MALKWNFQRGWGVQAKKPSKGGVWTFSGTTQWARDQASHLPTKSLKEQIKTCPGQAIFESYLPPRLAEIQVFFSLVVQS